MLGSIAVILTLYSFGAYMLGSMVIAYQFSVGIDRHLLPATQMRARRTARYMITRYPFMPIIVPMYVYRKVRLLYSDQVDD